ncbi:hypothetical protein [Bradyrhizobium sp. CCGUVB23]|uniref:hypothetical protein n=1 Tax=Bradyrhizobium sp. CCGUVB23 TaxID=2949630 RepID=UPI0020B2C282|nr:hypothetical protein [Bradyrhizobium sp. CCGUVB23]MCP3460010.1 hypothetical protein [Bradyrhizobium sp. CCGUVB23]
MVVASEQVMLRMPASRIKAIKPLRKSQGGSRSDAIRQLIQLARRLGLRINANAANSR